MAFFGFKKKTALPQPEECLPGRTEKMPVPSVTMLMAILCNPLSHQDLRWHCLD